MYHRPLLSRDFLITEGGGGGGCSLPLGVASGVWFCGWFLCGGVFDFSSRVLFFAGIFAPSRFMGVGHCFNRGLIRRPDPMINCAEPLRNPPAHGYLPGKLAIVQIVRRPEAVFLVWSASERTKLEKLDRSVDYSFPIF